MHFLHSLVHLSIYLPSLPLSPVSYPPTYPTYLQDAQSKARLAEVEKEIAALQDELRPLALRYDAEKHRVDEQQRLQNKVMELQRKISVAMRLVESSTSVGSETSYLPTYLLFCRCTSLPPSLPTNQPIYPSIYPPTHISTQGSRYDQGG